MKLIHTSDWHLGKHIEGHSRLEEQEVFIEDFKKIVEEREIDVILIAGDVYDNSNPPAKAEQLFYKALKELSDGGRRLVVIIAGNHDNPDRLSASIPLAKEQGIIIVGKPKDIITEGKVGQFEITKAGRGFFDVQIKGKKSRFLLLPYPSEQRLNETLSDKIDDEQELQRTYTDKVRELFEVEEDSDGHYTVAVSHLFVDGGMTSDSERPIQLGGSLVVNADDLPAFADYIALGHLHRPQRVRNTDDKAYYSGSPLQYSRSEIGYTKSVMEVRFSNDGGNEKNEIEIEEIYLSNHKPIEVWDCDGYEKALEQCQENAERDVWAYLEIHTDRVLMQSEIKALKEVKPDLLSITPIIASDENEEEVEAYKEKNIIEAFTDFYKDTHGVDPKEDLLELFAEIAMDGEGE